VQDTKIRHLGTIAQLLSGYICTTKARIDNRKRLVKEQYLPHTSLKYGELQPAIAAEIVSLVWGTPMGCPKLTKRWPQLISMGYASWQRYCTALWQWALAKLCGVEQRTPPIFGRAAITLGIRPHSSSFVSRHYIDLVQCRPIISRQIMCDKKVSCIVLCPSSRSSQRHCADTVKNAG